MLPVMSDTSRHLPLIPLPWEPATAKETIEKIVSEAVRHFDPLRFWPTHPQDEQSHDGDASVYFGGAGIIWAIDYLQRVGAVGKQIDFRPVLPRLLDEARARFESFGEYSRHGSLLVGDLGTALAVMRLAP